MARGIDFAAHDGALAANGKTLAVLGNGVDVIYPSENAQLYRKIANHGALVSEFTLGRHADRQTFPIRNRLIAGLCHAVIVVESDRFGGSMITARFAMEYGRHVFAVPGRIDSGSSAGCLALIKDGATMLTSIDDIFEDMPYLNPSSRQGVLPLDTANGENSQAVAPEASCPMEKKIHEILTEKQAATVDSIVEMSGVATGKILRVLQLMEIRGLTKKRYDGMVELIGAARSRSP
jgi:DNA processing protein